jgi:UDP-GlcNAc3NAcA epimerase
MTLSLLSVIGARPQFIKAAAVSRAIRATDDVKEILVHTGQHYDENMSAVFFEELEISNADYNLGIGSGSHGLQTGRMLESVEQVLLSVRPDWVLVYGDTNSTLAAAVASVKLHIPTAHIEAGLRSYNRRMPEEINRVLADHASDVLFAPTAVAVHNLVSEGIAPAKVHMVGDVMYDVALHYAAKAERTSSVLNRLGVKSRDYALSTIHRAENTDNPVRLRAILEALLSISSELPVILPLHPRTRATLERDGLLAAARALQIIEPVGYLDMVMLEKHAALIVTDSGGVQKEAYFYEVPCVTLRDETEWVELLEAGWNRLVPPTDANAVAEGIRSSFGQKGRSTRLYGDGKAASKIVSILKSMAQATSRALEREVSL